MQVTPQSDQYTWRVAGQYQYPLFEPDDWDGEVWWHGSPSGDLRGGQYGLHLGDYESARQALESRIGRPAEGVWDGKRVYGETPLAGYSAGYGAGKGSEPALPTGKAVYSDGSLVPLDSRPSLLPLRITGPMGNTRNSPYGDDEVHDMIQGFGNSWPGGYYYDNIGEGGWADPDTGKWQNSISAVVPGPDHVEPLDPDEYPQPYRTAAWRVAETQYLLPAMPVRQHQPNTPPSPVIEPPEFALPARTRILRKGPFRHHEAALITAAPVRPEIVDQIEGEFNDWWDSPEAIPGEDYNWIQTGDEPQAPINHWGTIENFMEQNYPEAYKGLWYGLETAGPMLGLDSTTQEVPDWLKGEADEGVTPYETGQAVMDQYGYDPKEVAAVMLLLHNQSHGYSRENLYDEDVQRLHDIAQKRHKMQRDFQERVSRKLLSNDWNPQEVTDRLNNEFYDWQDQQPEDRYDDETWNAGPGRWTTVEDFLHDVYPAAHRGFWAGREDAGEFLDDPGEASTVSNYQEPNEYGDPSVDWQPEPYQTDPDTIQSLGYDPEEIVAGMIINHLNSNGGGGGGASQMDKKRLVDIYQKRQKMQRDYEQKNPVTAAAAAPDHQEWAKRMMDRRWDTNSHTPAEIRQRHIDEINGQGTSPVPNAHQQAVWNSRPDQDEFSGPEWLPQDALPGMDDIRGENGRLLRGLPIDTTDPAFRRVWQMTYGQGEPVDDPGMFPDTDLRYEDRGGKFDHPGLADAIMDGLDAKGGAGPHWSAEHEIASDYGLGRGPGSYGQTDNHLPVLLDADWNGIGENYSRAGSGNYDLEKEVTLNKGAPLTVRDLSVPDQDEDYKWWQSAMGDTADRDITAATKQPYWDDERRNNWESQQSPEQVHDPSVKFAKDRTRTAMLAVPRHIHRWAMSLPNPEDLHGTHETKGSHGSRVYQDAEGNSWLAKIPYESHPFWLPLDVATAKLQERTGLPTPETYATTIGGKPGSIQKMYPDSSEAFHRPPHISELSSSELMDLQKHHVLDWLIANHDSHTGNFLRSPEYPDRLLGIDKGNAMKFFGMDRLDPDFHPNYYAREPVYNQLWRDFSAGQGELNDPRQGELADFIGNVQGIPDDDIKDMFREYAQQTADAGYLANPKPDPGRGLGPSTVTPNDPETFLGALVERKNNLAADFGDYYDRAGATRPAPPERISRRVSVAEVGLWL